MRPHLYKGPRPSVGWLVGPSVRPSIGNTFVKIDEKCFLWILNDLKDAGRGRKREEEEGRTKRKEGQREKSDEESEKMKNEKVA